VAVREKFDARTAYLGLEGFRSVPSRDLE